MGHEHSSQIIATARAEVKPTAPNEPVSGAGDRTGASAQRGIPLGRGGKRRTCESVEVPAAFRGHEGPSAKGAVRRAFCVAAVWLGGTARTIHGRHRAEEHRDSGHHPREEAGRVNHGADPSAAPRRRVERARGIPAHHCRGRVARQKRDDDRAAAHVQIGGGRE
eukprot:scaffold1908_cov104-Isochrysis_galbana.AAC.15